MKMAFEVEAVILSIFTALLLLAAIFIMKRKLRNRKGPKAEEAEEEEGEEEGEESSTMKRQKISISDSSSVCRRLFRKQAREFTYEELAEATEKFEASHILERGRFGCLYAGSISDGRMVAVLRCGPRNMEFEKELELMPQISHPNVVPLIGYHRGPNAKFLVYEFFTNRTLDFQLHSKKCLAMDWKSRMKMAVGIAKAIVFLHEESGLSLVHNDILSSNIVVNNDFEPMVADFGLAKIKGHEEDSYSRKVSMYYGYLSPEYLSNGIPTMEADVFSFGVVLLELITGRRAHADDFSEGNTLSIFVLKDWARPFLDRAVRARTPDVLDQFVDPLLEKSYDEKEALRMVLCAASALQLKPQKRLTVRKILRVLEGVESAESSDCGAASFCETLGNETNRVAQDELKIKKL